MRFKRSLAAFAPIAVAVTVAGCGGGSGVKSTSQQSGTAPTGGAGAGTTAAADIGITSSKLGSFLVDGHGRALYLFEQDHTSASTCYSACASIWPPLTSGSAPKVGGGVLAAKLGTTKRNDGQTQVTYGGHPLYYYAGDAAPGQTQGQGLNQFGAPWYVVAPSGVKIDNG